MNAQQYRDGLADAASELLDVVTDTGREADEVVREAPVLVGRLSSLTAELWATR